MIPPFHHMHAGLGIRVPGGLLPSSWCSEPASPHPLLSGSRLTHSHPFRILGNEVTWGLIPSLRPHVRGCGTLLVHCLTVLISSWITRSTHFRQGSFSLTTCFFTMASNAKSGVKSPVLKRSGPSGEAGKDKSERNKGQSATF